MDDLKVEELKAILARRGQKILDDPALLDNLLKDTSLSAGERASLLAAAKLGFPQALLAQQDVTTVPAAAFARYFNRLTQEMAISDDNARAALQRWASALGRAAPSQEGLPATSPKVTPAPAPQLAAPPSPPPQPALATPVGDRAIYVQAYRLLHQGKLPPQAAAELQSTGVDAATAANVVARVASFMTLMRDAYRQAGWKNIGIGMLWCIGGIVVTAITYGWRGAAEPMSSLGVRCCSGSFRRCVASSSRSSRRARRT
jgi:hypothetical protein